MRAVLLKGRGAEDGQMETVNVCPAVEEPSHCFKAAEQSNTVRLTGFMGPRKIGERRKSAPIRGTIRYW